MDFISITLYHKVLNHALKEGLPRELISHLPITRVASDNPPVVPADQFFELHEISDANLQAGCSVRVGGDMKIDDYGVLGLSWKTCSRAGEIFERSERYFKLLTNTYLFQIEHIDGVSKVHLHREAYRRGVELSNEATFAATVVNLKATTESDIGPTEVAFKHGAPREMTSYDECFQCPVKFDQPTNFIGYRSEDFNRRTAKADESINRFLLERVEEEANGIEVNANKIATDVKNLIKDALPSGIPSIIQVGEHLGMSNRTLTRRLSECGYTFRDLIKLTQEEISFDLLKNTSRSVSEVAFQTGFSEQSAFNRAFKRWTGQSPIEYRKSS